MKSLKPGSTYGESHDDSELWLISYADMVTLLLGFFVVLYSFSSIDDKRFSSISQEISGAFKKTKTTAQKGTTQTMSDEELTQARQLRALQLLISMLNMGDVDQAVAKIEQASSATKDIQASREILNSELKKSNFDNLVATNIGTIDNTTTVDLVIPAATLFEPGNASLSDSSSKKIREIGASLAKLPDLVEIEVQGHTDSSPVTRSALLNNWALSSARAGAVANELMVGGLQRSKVKVSGLGDLKPLFPERNSAGQPILDNMARNRRVHIIVRKRAHGP